MSGHSKWATIKHKKGAADAKRGKLFTKLIKEITVAARMGGGDPGGNPRLRKAISDAKGQAMPNDTIKRAVQRGTGELEGASYEEILYEGTGPGGTLFLCEAMTDNKNRTVAEIRKVFEKNNGALGAGGSAQWAFERKGIVAIAKDGATEDQLMEVAVGARARAGPPPGGARGGGPPPPPGGAGGEGRAGPELGGEGGGRGGGSPATGAPPAGGGGRGRPRGGGRGGARAPTTTATRATTGRCSPPPPRSIRC